MTRHEIQYLWEHDSVEIVNTNVVEDRGIFSSIMTLPRKPSEPDSETRHMVELLLKRLFNARILLQFDVKIFCDKHGKEVETLFRYAYVGKSGGVRCKQFTIPAINAETLESEEEYSRKHEGQMLELGKKMLLCAIASFESWLFTGDNIEVSETIEPELDEPEPDEPDTDESETGELDTDKLDTDDAEDSDLSEGSDDVEDIDTVDSEPESAVFEPVEDTAEPDADGGEGTVLGSETAAEEQAGVSADSADDSLMDWLANDLAIASASPTVKKVKSKREILNNAKKQSGTRKKVVSEPQEDFFESLFES